MGFNGGGALEGGASGAAAGAAFGPWGAGIGGGVGAIVGGFGRRKKKKTSQEIMESPEQRAARQQLSQFGRTGEFGGLTAGQDLNQTMGSYDMTSLENQGTASLANLIGSGQPGEFDMASASLRDLMDTSEAGIEKMFSPFSNLADRSTMEASDAARRNAAFSGNLYSTDTMRNLGNVAVRGQENKLASLAGLTNDAMNRKLSATGQAVNLGNARENTEQNRIGSAFQYGGLQRQLEDQKFKEQYAETLRKRDEIFGTQLGAVKGVAGNNSQFGVPSVETAKPNPWMDFLNLAAQGGSRYMASRSGRPSGGTYYGPSSPNEQFFQ